MSESADNVTTLGPRFRRFEPKDIAPLASLLVILVLMTAFTGGKFLRPATAEAVLKKGSVLMIVAVGLTYVMLCGEIDLAVGTIALWAAMLCGIGYTKHVASVEIRAKAARAAAADADEQPNARPPDPRPAAIQIPMFSPVVLLIIIGSLATAVGLGILSGTLTVWARLPSFIITLAMMNIAEGAAKYLSQSETFNVPDVLKTLGNGGVALTSWFKLPFVTVVAIIVTVVGHVVLQHTRFGRYIYMTGGNREAARLSGVRTETIVVACLAVSGLTAGLGGLLNSGKLNSISLDQNAGMLLSAVACVVLGGTSLFGGEGGMGRTVTGVVTISVLDVGLSSITWINELARQLLMGVVLMIALVVNGLLAKRSSR